MTIASNLQTFATRVATEAKALRTLINGNAADLAGLNTTAKGNLVAAINEVKVTADAAAGGGAAINDLVTATDSVWSSSKTNTEISTAVASVVDSSPATLDTLNELAAALGDDASFSATMTTALGNRVRVDAAQGLTSPQQTQARDNIGVTASADIGDPATNYVTTFEAGLV